MLFTFEETPGRFIVETKSLVFSALMPLAGPTVKAANAAPMMIPANPVLILRLSLLIIPNFLQNPEANITLRPYFNITGNYTWTKGRRSQPLFLASSVPDKLV
jgi:hypothetical protein